MKGPGLATAGIYFSIYLLESFSTQGCDRIARALRRTQTKAEAFEVLQEGEKWFFGNQYVNSCLRNIERLCREDPLPLLAVLTVGDFFSGTVPPQIPRWREGCTADDQDHELRARRCDFRDKLLDILDAPLSRHDAGRLMAFLSQERPACDPCGLLEIASLLPHMTGSLLGDFRAMLFDPHTTWPLDRLEALGCTVGSHEHFIAHPRETAILKNAFLADDAKFAVLADTLALKPSRCLHLLPWLVEKLTPLYAGTDRMYTGRTARHDAIAVGHTAVTGTFPHMISQGNLIAAIRLLGALGAVHRNLGTLAESLETTPCTGRAKRLLGTIRNVSPEPVRAIAADALQSFG